MAHLENAGERSKAKPIHLGLKGLRSFFAAKSEVYLLAILTIGLLALWEWLAYTERIPVLFFPAPSSIAQMVGKMVASGELLLHLSASLARLSIGFILGGTPALLLGLLMGWSERVRRFFDPVIAAVHPLPKVTMLPLMMIILGFGEKSFVAVVAVSTFFPLLINTVAGVREINPVFFEVARNYGLTGIRLFISVVLPGALPVILTGVRIALNNALLLTIVVELMAANTGLGQLLWFAWEVLNMEKMYASLLTIALLGMLLSTTLQRITGFLIPWAQKA